MSANAANEIPGVEANAPSAEAGWAAVSRGDFGEAARIAASLRARRPADSEGYQIGSLAARNLGRFDEAAAILDQARALFPGEAWLLFEAGWAAFARGAYVAALDIATELRERFPDNSAGYRLGCAAGRKLGWLMESASIAAKARARFPAEAWPLEEAGWTALARLDGAKAMALGAELRAGFPENANGFWISLAAARELRRFAEGEAVLAEAKRLFPTLDWPETAGEDAEPAADFAELSAGRCAGARLFANRRELIKALAIPRHATLVEVGVARGDFSDFLITLNDPIKFIAIDLFEMEKQPLHWGVKQETLFENMTHFDFYKRRFATLGERIEVKRGWSYERMEEIPDGACDLIYIDADHGYENVIREAEVALRKIKPDGIIVFNDYTLFDQFLKIPYGVVRAVNEIVNRENLRVVGFALERNMFCDIAVKRG